MDPAIPVWESRYDRSSGAGSALTGSDLLRVSPAAILSFGTMRISTGTRRAVREYGGVAPDAWLERHLAAHRSISVLRRRRLDLEPESNCRSLRCYSSCRSRRRPYS